MAMMRMQAQPLGHNVSFMFPTWSPYEHNVHRCIKQAIEDGADFMLSMDSDNPPMRNPLDLVELDLDVVGLPTPVWHSGVKGDFPGYWNALKKVGDAYKPITECGVDPVGLVQVDAIGSGCFLVARRVLLALRHKQPFARQWHPDGTVYKGGDYSFCEKATAAGFRIFSHFDYPCMHFNNLEITEVWRAFQDYHLKHATTCGQT